jgi:TIR domain
METTLKTTLKVFYSYSHKDQDYREQIEIHLSNLKKLYNLETWFDRQIIPGDNWEAVLEERLNTADLILLLISPDFIHSNYPYSSGYLTVSHSSKLSNVFFR